jgi:hypothetical protein
MGPGKGAHRLSRPFVVAGKRCQVRQFTWEEPKQVCAAARIPLPD